MFEGSITVLVPLQEAVFTEEDRQKFPTVNRNTTICIIAFYIFFSITCWMALGNDVRTVLTTSLPEGNAATTVQLAYVLYYSSTTVLLYMFIMYVCAPQSHTLLFPPLSFYRYSVAVIFTFPLQNYPALEIACRTVATCMEKCNTCQVNPALQHNATSSIMVVLLALVAATTMESLDKVVSFLGGLLGCPIAFIFPPLIHLKLAERAGTLTRGRKMMNILVAVLGFVAMVLSTSTTLIAG
jgi:proton-coupled amino acid transporter